MNLSQTYVARHRIIKFWITTYNYLPEIMMIKWFCGISEKVTEMKLRSLVLLKTQVNATQPLKVQGKQTTHIAWPYHLT